MRQQGPITHSQVHENNSHHSLYNITIHVTSNQFDLNAYIKVLLVQLTNIYMYVTFDLT
jgi:hypothetical protein